MADNENRNENELTNAERRIAEFEKAAQRTEEALERMAEARRRLGAKAVNIVLDADLWRALSIASARLGITKREAVSRAIARWIEENDPDTYRELQESR